MRTIHTDDIIKNIKEMCIAVNVKLSPDVRNAILTARENEESEIGSQILGQLEENMDIAYESKIPICQDTGMAVVFLKIGQDSLIDGIFNIVSLNV